MTRVLLSIFTALFLPCLLIAGGIKGYVRNDVGDVLEFATIYVHEANSGTVTNEDGYYEFRMLPGEYRVVFQHLGYETHTERVIIGQGMTELNIQLSPQVFDLESVEIIDGGENAAYTVMRKAIAKADFHRQQLDYYKAQVYIKGSGRLLNTPWIARKMLEKEGVKGDSTTAYTSESVSIIEYERPNTYKERVISVFSQGDDNGASPMQFINGSFYDAEIASAISPLSPRAFAYYKFELVGYYTDRAHSINKIKVTPRSRGDNIFEGYIYIVENSWAIHSVDLKTYLLGIEFNIKQIFAPIQDEVWLPVSHKYIIKGKIYGFAFDYNYLATISDYDIRINPDLDVDFAVIDEKIEKEAARTSENRRAQSPRNAEIEDQLAIGEELTRKDLKKLMRSYEKEERAEAAEEQEEIVVSNHTYEVDSLASRRDSAYWAVIRPIPLTTQEVRGYFVEDSTAVADKAIAEEQENGVKKSNQGKSGFSVFDILGGTSFKIDDDKYFHYDGIKNAGFNPVEGYWLASRLRYTQNGKDNKRFRLHATPRYGLSWNRLLLKVDTDYRFGKKKYQNNIRLGGGRYVAQYNEPHPVNELFNTIYALLGERNFVHIYEKEFVEIKWDKHWRETTFLKVNLEWTDRTELSNTTGHTWINNDTRTYDQNLPSIIEAWSPDLIPLTEKAATLGFILGVRPWQKYKTKNGDQSAMGSDSPLFTLDFQTGIADINKSVSDYQRLGLSYRHTIRPGIRGKLDVKVDMGLFLSDNYVGLADYKHFKGNEMILTGLDPVGSFRLLPYYTHSTKDKWLSAHVHYQFRKFLFTQIWEVQMLGAKENVFVNYLNTPTSKNYTEVGYGIDNILRFLRIEAVASFRDGRYHDWGIRIGIASNIFGGFGSVSTGSDD